MPKTIFITGASTGIGKVTALHFAQKGWNVAATMRNPSKAADFEQSTTIRLYKLDVMDEISIATAIDSAIRDFGGIDVIFNNAGYALAGAFEAMSNEQLRRQFDTNVFGAMNVIRAILPYFREKRSGTIINTTSMGGLMAFPLFSAYHGTKWALEGFAESLHYELKPFNIKVKNIEPGAIKTDFYDRSMEYVSMEPYDGYISVVNANTTKQAMSAVGPEVVARKVFKAANSANFRLRYPVGGNGPVLLFVRWLIPHSWFKGIVRSILEKGYSKQR